MKITALILLPVVLLSFSGLVIPVRSIALADTTNAYATSTQELKSSEIPKEIFNMYNLRSLSIQGMDCDYRQYDEQGNDVTQCWGIGTLPPEISNLKGLEVLNLPVNGIRELPEYLSTLPKLRVINFSDNPGLYNIDVIARIPTLEEAYFYGCSIQKLPADLSALKKLKKLGLVGNPLNKEEVQRIRKSLPGCEISAD